VHTPSRWCRTMAVVDTEATKEVVDVKDILTIARSGRGGGEKEIRTWRWNSESVVFEDMLPVMASYQKIQHLT
jgi:hypothetical protein